jgi:hypothetical protein
VTTNSLIQTFIFFTTLLSHINKIPPESNITLLGMMTTPQASLDTRETQKKFDNVLRCKIVTQEAPCTFKKCIQNKNMKMNKWKYKDEVKLAKIIWKWS